MLLMPEGIPAGDMGAVINRRGKSAGLPAGQCTPHFSFGLAKRETGRARSKEKKRFGRNFARTCKVAVRGLTRDGACGFAMDF